jgi:polysaccharide pyruvyl transferase WcaK-like protein
MKKRFILDERKADNAMRRVKKAVKEFANLVLNRGQSITGLNSEDDGIVQGFSEKQQNDKLLPTIYPRDTNLETSIIHVSAFSYGNAGDTLLPVALRDLWHEHQPEINWISQAVYPIVDEAMVEKINQAKGIVIGGGGLFLKDTNPNQISGWQWPCSTEMLKKIEVPIVMFAVGYNRFRGQDDFDPVFKENITAFAEKSVYLGLRNHGSIESLKQYLTQNLHQKLVYQPCPTTFLKRLYPNLANYNEKEDFFVLNCAFDRPHLRFGKNVGKILSDISLVCKEVSKYLPLKFYSHMQSDQAIVPFLQSYQVEYEVVDLQNAHPRRIIEEYTKPKLVLGMRGHAQLIPFGCNTPIVSIVSHNKMQWFLEDIGQPEWGTDVLSPSFKSELLQKSLSALNNYQSRMTYIDEKIDQLYTLSLHNSAIAVHSMLNHKSGMS